MEYRNYINEDRQKEYWKQKIFAIWKDKESTFQWKKKETAKSILYSVVNKARVPDSNDVNAASQINQAKEVYLSKYWI